MTSPFDDAKLSHVGHAIFLGGGQMSVTKGYTLYKPNPIYRTYCTVLYYSIIYIGVVVGKKSLKFRNIIMLNEHKNASGWRSGSSYDSFYI